MEVSKNYVRYICIHKFLEKKFFFVIQLKLNVSGYMICRYLIERMGRTPDKAIRTFNEARGYEITREQDLRSL